MKKIHLKLLLRVIVILFLLCHVTSCSQKVDNDKIRIGILEGPSIISFIQMMEKEYKINGKEIEFIVKSEPSQIQAMMMKNQLDFAILPTVMAVNLYNKGVKYRMLGCPMWGTLYLVSKNKDIASFNDLHNNTLHIFGQGSTADILTQHNIKQQNITCNIDYRFKTNMELAQALLMSEVESAILSEPLVSIICDKDPTIKVIEAVKCQRYIGGMEKNIFIQSAFLVSERFINDKSDLISEICNLYVNSCNFVNDRPDEAAKLLVKHQVYPNTELAEKSINLCNIQYVAGFALLRELHSYLQIFHSTNAESIGGKNPSPSFIYQVY